MENNTWFSCVFNAESIDYFVFTISYTIHWIILKKQKKALQKTLYLTEYHLFL